MVDRCRTCKAWEALPGNEWGSCRRHAPLPDKVSPGDRANLKFEKQRFATSHGLQSVNIVAVWPITSADDWCLDHVG